MAFVDTLLQETDAHITIVDPRAAPGGHWNDAYPFVRLHQPSILYGVASRRLGRDAIESSGDNQGYYELATGAEVAAYFREVMEEVFLPSGRVSYHPSSVVAEDGAIRSLASGQTRRIHVRRKVVDASRMAASIPLTHKRSFTVREGVVCIPPNDLPFRRAAHDHVTVIGAGKTGLDVVTWLLSNGMRPDRIRWIMPRDPWIANRRAFQPGPALLKDSLQALADQTEIWARAISVDDLSLQMEAGGHWMRLNRDVVPTLYHGAIATAAEVDRARSVTDVVRLGRVVDIGRGLLRLTQGEIDAPADSLYVDCSASALAHTRKIQDPIFAPETITLQSVRFGQLCFSAALIAYLEAHGGDDETRNRLCRPTPMSDTVEEWIPNIVTGSANRSAWMKIGPLRDWILQCRLDPMTGLIARMAPSDPDIRREAERLRAASAAADANLKHLMGLRSDAQPPIA
jgi:hypothetical protein